MSSTEDEYESSDETITINTGRSRNKYRRNDGLTATGKRIDPNAKGERQKDGYVKTGKSKQDLANEKPETINAMLHNYKKIPPEKWSKIRSGTFIRYVGYDKDNTPRLRYGGLVAKNGHPVYLVLRSGKRGRKNVSWSVQLAPKGKRPPDLYMKANRIHTLDEKLRHGVEVYHALNSGKYMLIETETLEHLTGEILTPAKKRRRRIKAEAVDDDAEAKTDTTRQKIKARFIE